MNYSAASRLHLSVLRQQEEVSKHNRERRVRTVFTSYEYIQLPLYYPTLKFD